MTRKEISGLHLYDKETGLHVLFDEIQCDIQDIRNCGPRQLSIMLTKKCNLDCSYCYAEKGTTEIDWNLLVNILDASQDSSVLDITLGGGEPTLYSRFKDLIRLIDKKYQFGLSVTTNGENIDVFQELRFKFSKIRISIDSYKRTLNNDMKLRIKSLQKNQNIGINILYSPNSNLWLQETINELKNLGLSDILIIPEHRSGNFILQDYDWLELERIIKSIDKIIDIKLTEGAEKHINIQTLHNSHKNEFLFLHIDDLGNLKERSWSKSKSLLQGMDKQQIVNEFIKLNKGVNNENLE